MKKKLISTLLAMALVLSMTTIPVMAASTQNGLEATEAESPDYLGTISEDEGFLRSYPDDVVRAAPHETRAKTQLFSMSIGTIYDLLTSYAAGKSFTRGSLTNDYLTISGKLKHSSGYSVKNGACYLSNGIFSTQVCDWFTSNEEDSATYYYTQFGGSTTYYGFVKNDSGVPNSYVTGTTLYFYNGR